MQMGFCSALSPRQMNHDLRTGENISLSELSIFGKSGKIDASEMF
jgi:hypothetical protein